MSALRALAGLIGGESRSLEDPATPITPATLAEASMTDLWGPTSYDTADPMQIGTFFRCVQILAATVGGLPFRARRSSTHTELEVPAFAEPTLVDGEYTLSRRQIVEALTVSLVVRGNAYARKWRDSQGRVIRLIPIHPRHVEVKWSAAARRSGRPPQKRFIIDGREELTSRDIMHVQALSDDGVLGMSVIGQAARTLAIASAAERTALRMANANRPNGILSTDKPVSAEQAREVGDAFVSRLGASGNSGARPLVLGQGLKWEAVDLSPEDLEFLEQRRFSRGEVAGLLGMPGWMVGERDKTSTWGAGMEQEFRAWVTVTVRPIVQRIEDRIEIELLDPRLDQAEFDLEGLLRGDSKSRAAFYASGIQHGWFVPNEVRALEKLPPVEWGDVPYRPYNEPAPIAGDDDEKERPDDDDS